MNQLVVVWSQLDWLLVEKGALDWAWKITVWRSFWESFRNNWYQSFKVKVLTREIYQKSSKKSVETWQKSDRKTVQKTVKNQSLFWCFLTNPERVWRNRDHWCNVQAVAIKTVRCVWTSAARGDGAWRPRAGIDWARVKFSGDGLFRQFVPYIISDIFRVESFLFQGTQKNLDSVVLRAFGTRSWFFGCCSFQRL